MTSARLFKPLQTGWTLRRRSEPDITAPGVVMSAQGVLSVTPSAARGDINGVVLAYEERET